MAGTDSREVCVQRPCETSILPSHVHDFVTATAEVDFRFRFLQLKPQHPPRESDPQTVINLNLLNPKLLKPANLETKATPHPKPRKPCAMSSKEQTQLNRPAIEDLRPALPRRQRAPPDLAAAAVRQGVRPGALPRVS